jgi:hypothetical protein
MPIVPPSSLHALSAAATAEYGSEYGTTGGPSGLLSERGRTFGPQIRLSSIHTCPTNISPSSAPRRQVTKGSIFRSRGSPTMS